MTAEQSTDIALATPSLLNWARIQQPFTMRDFGLLTAQQGRSNPKATKFVSFSENKKSLRRPM